MNTHGGWLLLALLAACTGSDDGKATETESDIERGGDTDADNDGFDDTVDCDDSDDSVYPNAPELCDGVDNDCNDLIDDADEVDDPSATAFYVDLDLDGYGAGSPVSFCEDPGEGYSATDDDCDDGDSAYHPGADESDCSDPNDYNCDGSVGFTDGDGDGFAACEECDDSNGNINPDATEICNELDDDCDTFVDDDDDVWDTGTGALYHVDADEDGYGDPDLTDYRCDAGDGYSADSTDCDDTTDVVHPGADEICDELDNDCDGAIDDEDDDLDASTGELWYADDDADGYGSAIYYRRACEQPEEYVANADDCDDSDEDIHPGATEVCDDEDNDCDDAIDDEDTGLDTSSGETFYADVDDDGYGDAESTTLSCEVQDGYADNDEDCDDSDEDIHPGATEICDELDNDCDGDIDAADDDVDDSTGETFYADADADGYGDADSTTTACEAPSGYVDDSSDCDDADADVSPSATEICDGLDNDCDDDIDDDDSNVDTGTYSTYYRDRDKDGYGDASASRRACDTPTNYTDNDEDCDDGSASISPDATEQCDGADNDCDGLTDDDDTGLDGSTGYTFYADDDGDGFGDADNTTDACLQPSGYLSDDDDCDDSDEDINPDADEVCDEIDNDCDGDIDDDDPSLLTSSGELFYQDKDGDGYGSATSTSRACELPSGYVDNSEDCDDGDTGIQPKATEICDGRDNDCDGYTDDEDTGLDTGLASTFYVDDDGDGYGDADASVRLCRLASGYSGDAADCDDGDSDVHPGATETCDGVNEDCDGATDETVLGTGEDCPGASCKDILLDDTGAPDDDYWVDFDGTSTLTSCDMTTNGGGWTLVFEDDFESTPDSGWSESTTTTCSGWGTDILAGYGVSTTTVDIDVDLYGISHASARVSLDYMVIDSWDGEEASIDIDGRNLFTGTFNYTSASTDYCGNSSWPDQYYSFSDTVSSTSDTLTLEVSNALDQGATDESMGLDNVEVWIR